jgi:predicted  nucleic acid-binding Zn-ribbon protein
MNATEQATLVAAQAAVQEAQQRVEALIEAQQMLDRQLPEAQSVLRAAHANLSRAKVDSRSESRKAEIASLQQRIADTQSEESHHAH